MATGVSKTRWTNGAVQHTNGTGNGKDIRLTYAGKDSEADILNTPSIESELVWPLKPPSADLLNNRLYYGDNLPTMASLLSDPAIRGQVRLVYIDPPFGTKSVFQSRKQSDAYTDTLGGGAYLEFLRKRLILLRELLADDGSIYLHLDENTAFEAKILMDEIFGRRNFRNWITRRKCNRKNYTRKVYGNVSDYILFYSKTDRYVFNRPVETWTATAAEREYSYIEEKTGRRYKRVPIHAPGIRNGATGKPWRGMMPPPGKHWQYTPDKLDQMDARGEIYWSANGNPRRKIYFDQSAGVPYQDIWLDFIDAHNQNIAITGYPTEKNPALLALIIKASSNPGDLVLDCFSGSGTTLAIADVLKRHWLGIDNSQEAISTTLRRFLKGTEPMGDFVSERNGKTKRLSNNPTLFDTPPTADAARPANGHTPITDFGLHASKEVAGDIRPVISAWIKDLSKHRPAKLPKKTY